MYSEKLKKIIKFFLFFLPFPYNFPLLIIFILKKKKFFFFSNFFFFLIFNLPF